MINLGVRALAYEGQASRGASGKQAFAFRALYNDVLVALKAAGREVAHLKLAQPMNILPMQRANAEVRADDFDMGSLQLNGQVGECWLVPGICNVRLLKYQLWLCLPTG